MNLTPEVSTFCRRMWTEQTGGSVMVDYIEMENDTIIGITDECICTYKDWEQIDSGEYEDVIYLMECDKVPYISMSGIFKKILKLCDGNMSLAKKAIEQLFRETTIFRMGEIIDNLK